MRKFFVLGLALVMLLSLTGGFVSAQDETSADFAQGR